MKTLELASPYNVAFASIYLATQIEFNRTQDDDIPVSANFEPIPAELRLKYLYRHFNLVNCIGSSTMVADAAELIMEETTSALRSQTQFLDGVKLDNITLRVIKYQEEGSMRHYDPNYLTFVVGEIKNGKFTGNNTLHIGTHASSVDSSLKPTFHEFFRPVDYALVVFYNFESSHHLDFCGRTVGEDVEYYRKN